ncbi:MAG: metallophosphoesterase [Xanthobacteraceae bacterium]|nr:metallophosphoesterase [Xanthobacteraceae bacterium]
MKARMTRRRVLGGAAGLIGASALATGIYAGGIEPMGLVVTRYPLNPPGWPARRKLSMTVIADLHAGGPDMTLPHIRHVIDTANALKSDVVVLLGDYTTSYRVANKRVPYGAWAAELARLAAPLGTWAILGNHDWWNDLMEVRQTLAGVRIPVMENQAVMLGAEGERFWLAGLGDQIAHRLGHGRFRGVDDLPGTLAQIKTDDPVVLLAHEPDIFPDVPARVTLTLCGHTHGGQIRLPLVWPAFVPSKYGARFAYGHVVEEGRHLIVSGGLGTSIIPARLGVPPEIVRVELGSSSDQQTKRAPAALAPSESAA